MTFEYNGNTYEVTRESIYRDFGINTYTLEDGCRILNELDGMTDYVFNLVPYSDMVVTKRAIVVTDDGITVRVILRHKTEAELAKKELDDLRSDIEAFASTASKTNAAKLNNILAKGVS